MPSDDSVTGWPSAAWWPTSMCSAAPRWPWPTIRALLPAMLTPLFKPHGIVLEEARAVAAELGLPNWWLNEQASSYAAPSGDPSASACSTTRAFVSSPLHPNISSR